jgi:ferredoxin
MRRRVLRVESEIRRRVAAGSRSALGALWDGATAALAAQEDEAFLRDARRARAALDVDGEVAGCDASLPARFVRHAWSVVQDEKRQAARARIDGLATRLGDILRADFMRSEQALQQPVLQASFGSIHQDLFDFAAMAKVLQRVGPAGGLGERRRARIERARAALESQRFFPEAGRGGGFEFAFDGPDAALAAFRSRLPELVQLLAALQVAELEVAGNYLEELHDPIFAAFDAASVTGRDLQFFPDYLVCIDGARGGPSMQLTEALSSGVPLKIAVQVEDLLEEASPGQAHFALGLRGAQLASAAMSLDEVFVLQTAASNLVQLQSRLRQGLRHPGPALFSVYAGPAKGGLPGYLAAAAAMQSRAFPAFSYDPAAGADLASRFSLENNPQPERDWPLETITYADPDLQSVTEETAFTLADFAACDPRHASHFAAVPRAAWADAMIPAHRWLESPPPDASGGVPFVLAVDEADLLCRLVVDERLMRSGVRCREAWHRLQELGGIRDSRVERLLAKERELWEELHRREAPAAAAVEVPEPAAVAASPAIEPGAQASVAEPARNPDEAYVETVRCSTCNECTQLNPRMFAYNENKQAYLKDVKAGTYAQLVEAAESCQVSIIHPGKPWNPEEPGLAELVERAKPFL